MKRGHVPIYLMHKRALYWANSPPPCGEGLGVGVVRWSNTLPHCTTPLPNPPPQGGREQPEFAAHSDFNSQETALARASAPFSTPINPPPLDRNPPSPLPPPPPPPAPLPP